MISFIEYILEYTEEQGGTFQDGDDLYDINKIFDAVEDKEVRTLPVSKIDWIIPDRVSAFDRARARKKEIDLTVPIIVTKKSNKYLVVDGYHRLLKAEKLGVHSLPYKEISKRELEDCKV